MDKKTFQQLSLFEAKTKAQTKQSFDLKLKPKKKNLVKELVLFLSITSGTFLLSYGALNYNALSQLAGFKWDRVKTSVIEVQEEYQEKKEAKLTVQEEKERNIKKHAQVKPKNHAMDLLKDLEVLPSDNRIYIPSINKNIPLVDVPNHNDWKKLENDIQVGLQNGVVVHPVSHDPGNFGNFFVTGHSSYYAWDKGRYKDVFALLHELETEEDVYIYWEGKKYVYRIGEKKVVSPAEVSVLNQPKDKKIITLMTCTPIGTNKNRLILTGELIEEESY